MSNLSSDPFIPSLVPQNDGYLIKKPRRDTFFKILLDTEKVAKRTNEEKIDTVHSEGNLVASKENETEENVSENSSYMVTSDFSETECGEPMISQHITLDFTPIVGFDDASFVQEKCAAFWDFVYKEPRLQQFVVTPTKEDKLAEKAESTSKDTLQYLEEPTPAIDWLDQEAGQPSAFSAKFPTKYCEYPDADKNGTCGSISAKKQKQEDETKEVKVRRKKRQSQPSIVKMCEQMEEWDEGHPKSMDPPGPVITLLHAVLQRNKD